MTSTREILESMGRSGVLLQRGRLKLIPFLYYTQDKFSLQLYKPLIQNQMSDIVTILNVVIKHMTSVEAIIKLTGDEKKELVINMLEKNMPNYQDYKELVPVIMTCR